VVGNPMTPFSFKGALMMPDAVSLSAMLESISATLADVTPAVAVDYGQQVNQ
jgi:hypothetical protein